MTTDYIIQPLSAVKHINYDASDDLSARVFSRYPLEKSWCSRMRRHPSFTDEHIRTAIAPEGDLLAQLYLIDRTIQIDRTSLRMCGVAEVGTDPAYRNKGLASALMHDALAYMGLEGYDISILFSIPTDYYTRFGYMTVFPDYSTTIRGLSKLNSLKSRPTDLKIRSISRKNIPALAHLYSGTYQDVTGICDRDVKHWQWLLHHPDFDGFMVLDSDRVVAYVLLRVESENLIVHEVGIEPSPRVHDAILRTLSRKALAAGLTILRLELPPDLPISRVCTLEHEGIQQVIVPHNRAGMAKIINLFSTLKKLESTLSDRLKKSQFMNTTRDIYIDTDIGSVCLQMTHGTVVFKSLPDDHPEPPDIAIPQSALLGLIFGLFYPSHIWELWGRPMPEDVLSILTVLFPKRFPQVCWVDHF